MEYDFELRVKLRATVDHESLSENEKTYGGMLKINTFIKELFNSPAAVKSFYRSYFLEKYINQSKGEWNEMVKHLDYVPHFGPIFIEVAKQCPKSVENFIDDIYSNETSNLRENIRKKIDRGLLEGKLQSLNVISASFTFPKR